MTASVFDDLDRLLAAAPAELGTSGWVAVDRPAVEAFRAAVGASPAAGAPAAGAATAGDVPPMLLLSLTNRLLPELMQVPGAASGVNYGAESVRFGPPVAVGSRIRATAVLAGCREVPGGVQTEVEIRIEAEGSAPEPACVVRSLSRWLR